MKTMRARAALVFVLALVLACGCASAPTTTPRAGTGAAPAVAARASGLPFAENGVDVIDGPLIALDGSRITVDGEAGGDISDIEREKRIRRIDPLFEILAARRLEWKRAHPNASSFPGVAVLRVDASAKAVVVKSMFQTAAFAGYPNGGFLVQSIAEHNPRQPQRLAVDAQVPGAPKSGEAPETSEKVLHVEVLTDKFVLLWKQDGAVLALVEVPRKELRTRVGNGEALRFPELASKVTQEWSANGQHRVATDAKWDQAVVRVANDADHEVLVAVIDALHAPKRAVGIGGRPDESMPAFNVTFSIGAPTGTGGPSGAGGRLAPETIQKTIRADFGSMRQCYEKALAKKADLRGRITVAFTIERDGSVSNAELAPSADALVDPVVTACVVARFAALKFPRPDGGIVKVVYPIIFNAAD